MSDADTKQQTLPATVKPKHFGTPFKPGNIGSRHRKVQHIRTRLSRIYAEALYEDFLEFGQHAIERVRNEEPVQYLKVIASILPKELHVRDETLDGVTDNVIGKLLSALEGLDTGANGEIHRDSKHSGTNGVATLTIEGEAEEISKE